MTNTKKLKTYLSALVLGFMGCLIISCSDSDFDADSEISGETVQNYIDQSIYSIQAESNIGRMGCFEFIFPVTIEYPDGTTSTVEDYDNLRAQLKEWAENNAEVFANEDENDEDSDGEGKGGNRIKFGYKGDIDWDLLPSLSFPLEVVAEDGTLSTISDQTELFELKRTCRKDFYGSKGRHGHHKGDRCFSLVFPLTLVLPDATTITGADRQDLKTQIRDWKSNNPDATEKPTLQYPVTIELEDGTTQEVASVEDFTALKESCSESD